MSFLTTLIAISILLFNFGSSLSFAAVMPQALRSPHEQWLMRDGAARGGVADAYMSLFDVRKSVSKKLKTERVVVDWGDSLGRPAAKGGYYQVEYQEKSRRVLVNLGLTLNSKIDAKKLTARLANGLYIKQAKLEFDSSNQSQTLVLDLKRPVHVRVAPYPSHLKAPQVPARLVVDLVE